MRKEKSEAEKIKEARENCEKFKKNPAGTLFLSAVYITAIAICVRPVWNHIYIDFSLIKSWDACIFNLVLLAAAVLLYRQCSDFFKGSEDDPDKSSLQTTGVILICAGILAALISGYTTDKYGWIESEARKSLNQKVLNYGSVKCTSVDIDHHSGDIYYGMAKLSDGTERPTVVNYMLLKFRRYSVEYLVSARFMR